MSTFAVYARLIIEADNKDQALVLAGAILEDTDGVDDFWVEAEYEETES